MKLAQAINFQQIMGEAMPDFKFRGATIGYLVSQALDYVFVIAGLLLLFFLIAGGFELLTSAGNPEKVKSGQGKLTSALIGFFIIFVSYWLVQVVEVIFGVNILG